MSPAGAPSDPRWLALLPEDALAAPAGHRTRETFDRLGPALGRRGVELLAADLDQVWLEDGVVRVAGADGTPLAPGDFAGAFVLGFGRRGSALDRLQLLELARGRWITPPSTLLLQHAKYGTGHLQRSFPVPRTLAGSGAHLARRLRALPPGNRLVKPPAGSFGDAVALLPRDPHRAAAVLEAAGTAFRVVQDRVPGPELRVLLAGGRVVGAYVRRGAPGVAANRARGGRAELREPGTGLRARLEALGAELTAAGIGWAGVDLKGQHLLEVNLVNPGGLGTLAELGDTAAADRAAAALLALAGPRDPAGP